MRRFPVPIGWPEVMFAGVVLAAFFVVGVVLGRVSLILHTCTTSKCQPFELYVAFNPAAGLVGALVAVLILVGLGALRDRRTG